MKYFSILILILAASGIFFFIWKESSRPPQAELLYIIQRPSTEFPESEEFFLPGSPLTFHVPYGFYLSDAQMSISPSSGNGPACLQHDLSTGWQNRVSFTFANSTDTCMTETSYPHASNIHIQQPFMKICNNPLYRACAAFSPEEGWQAIHAFSFIPEFSDPENGLGSLAYFYAFYRPEQQTGYDTIVISLLLQNAAIRPDEFEAKVAELSTELASDHPLYTFQQDMKTLNTFVGQIVFDEVEQ